MSITIDVTNGKHKLLALDTLGGEGGLDPSQQEHVVMRLSRCFTRRGSDRVNAVNCTRSVRVGVLGGGFGGVYAALRLEEVSKRLGITAPTVTLFDSSDRFVFKPLLYELVSGEYTEREVAPQFATLLSRHEHVSHVKAHVTSIECANTRPRAKYITEAHSSTTRGSTEVEEEFDYLVVALGSSVPTDSVPGAREHALPFNSLEDAQKLKHWLDRVVTNGDAANTSVAVVGGGYTGAELAATVAARFGTGKNVRIVSSRGIMPNDPAQQREIANRSLERAGVQVTPGRVTAVHPGSISVALSDGGTASDSETQTFGADLVLWTTGSSARVPTSSGLQLDDRGRICVEPSLRARNTQTVFAVGDAAVSGDPSTAQVALQQANYAAWNVAAHASGRPMLPFRYQHLGNMMSLGPGDGAIALPIGNLALNGSVASAIRKAAYVYRMPTPESAASTAVGFASSLAQQFTGSSRFARSVDRTLSAVLPRQS